MIDKNRYIAACEIPDIILSACNALGIMPFKRIDESRLEQLRPSGWFISPSVFSAHMDFLLPYRKNIVIWTDSFNNNRITNPKCLSIYDKLDLWIETIEYLLNQQSPFHGETMISPLTSREKDVLRLIASGLTGKEIANTLNISTNTVITHKKNLSAKLGIKSASGLSLYALMNGII